MHSYEYNAARKAVTEGRLQASDYSKMHPALFLLGLICWKANCYPLFMHFRNRAGYFCEPVTNRVTLELASADCTLHHDV